MTKWVLSFSADWQHLKGVHKMSSRHADQGVDVFWLLGAEHVPLGMAFIKDRKKKSHYFLTVTQRMKLGTLIDHLNLIAQRMSRIEQVALSR